MKSFVFACFVTLVYLFYTLVQFYVGYRYNVECGGHLKRAADANSVEIAQKELKIAVDYLSRNRMTGGNTSIIFDTPDNDVAFWYENLSGSLKELEELSTQEKEGAISGIEKTNALIKLRETLLDHGHEGREIVTQPDRISMVPHHVINFWIGWILLIVCLLAWGGFLLVNVDELR